MPSPSSTSSSEATGAGRLLLRLVVTATAVAATVLLVFYFIPEGNDVASVHIDKHEALERARSPKIVFVGGSNLMYGLDSKWIEDRLGIPTVNMGLNGYLGPRFLLNEVKQDLHKGDVAVVAFEYEAYFEPRPYPELGIGEYQALLARLRPSSARYIDTPGMWKNVAVGLPRIAQTKIFRLVNEAGDRLLGTGGTVENDPDVFLNKRIETRSGFNRNGDLVSHLDVAWSFWRNPGPSLANSRPAESVASTLREFLAEMSSKGVVVALAPPPAPIDWFEQNRDQIRAAFKKLAAAVEPAGCRFLGEPEEYVYPESFFFDNVNHLNSQGRPLRTQVVADYLQRLIAETGVRN